MNCVIIVISFLVRSTIATREYGLLFENNRSYLQTGYLTLCDECGVKVEVLINRTSGVLMYAENRVREVSLVVYFDRPGIYANVTDGPNKYNLPLTLDFFSSEWFGWHDLEIQIKETRMQIMFDNSMRQTSLKGKYLFPEDIVEENEIYFGASPRWSGVKNVTGFNGYMKNFKYRSCGCMEWRSMEIVNMVGVSTEHLGDCKSPQSCPPDCSCYLFPWGGKRCECPDLQCLQKSNEVSYDFDKSSLNLGRIKIHNDSDTVLYETGVIGDSILISDKSSLALFVATGRSCFKNIFLCEKGFAHSFWILPKVTSQPELHALIMKHSSSLDSTHGLTVTRNGNNIHATLVTHEGMQFKVHSLLQVSIWSLITIIYNKTHLSLYENAYLKDVSIKSTKLNHTFPELISTRFLFVGNNKDNPDVQVDNYNFTYNIHLPRLQSIQDLRLEQHSTLRKVNYNCNFTVDDAFVDLTKCFKTVFLGSTFTEFYISIIFNLHMEKRRMIIVRSPFINITSEMYTALHIDLINEPTMIVKLKLVTSRLYYIEISMNSLGNLVIRQSINTVILNVTLSHYARSEEKYVTSILVNKDRNAVEDFRFINADRDFATKALRIITNDIETHSVDFDHSTIDNFKSIQLTEGYIDQGLLLKYPLYFLSSNWFGDACFKYVASCYHGFTMSFWMKIINNFQYFHEPYFKVFSSGSRGISMFIGKDGLYFVMVIGNMSMTKFIPAPNSFEMYQWCNVELAVSPNGIASLYLNGREAKRAPVNVLPPSYKCSQFCLRAGNDKEFSVSMVIDEIKTWSVERDYLFANGYLSSDTQSLLQQQKKRETTIKELSELTTTLKNEKSEMKAKLHKLEMVLEKIRKEMKTLLCRRQSKNKLLQNDTNQSESDKNATNDYVNEIIGELRKLRCFDDNRANLDNGKLVSNDGADPSNRTEEIKDPREIMKP